MRSYRRRGRFKRAYATDACRARVRNRRIKAALAGEPEVRDQRVPTAHRQRLRRMAVEILADLRQHPEGLTTGYFCRRYGSSWRTRISDVRLHLRETTGDVLQTLPLEGTTQMLYRIVGRP